MKIIFLKFLFLYTSSLTILHERGRERERKVTSSNAQTPSFVYPEQTSNKNERLMMMNRIFEKRKNKKQDGGNLSIGMESNR